MTANATTNASTAYSDRRSVSARLHERALAVMPGGNTRTTVHRDPFPPYVAKGRGALVTDVEGEERIDFLNNYTALIHGHADPDIVAAVDAQMALGSSFGLPTPSEIDLAELLVARIPSVEQIRFTNSGTEAVMVAIQAARAFTGRPLIARFEGAYHGVYDFAAVGTAALTALAPGEQLVAKPHAAGTPEAVAEHVVVLRYNDVAGLERAIAAHGERLAAILIDLMPWRMGLIAAEAEFVRAVRELTHAHGVLMICDEVITFRVAPGGLQTRYDVEPDLTTLGKVIGGGFPVGAVGGRADVMTVFDPRAGQPKVPHGGTFTANPVTMAAGLATIRKLTPETYERLDALCAALREGLADTVRQSGLPGYVTGGGSLFGIGFGPEPGRDFRGWCGDERARAWRGEVYETLLARGAIVAPHLVGCLSTPMTRADIDTLIDHLRFVLERVKPALGSGTTAATAVA
jgi:glutamate-1-semialdehyde 2,1-aminomutase